jgi:pantoate--beta-alanine ligase
MTKPARMDRIPVIDTSQALRAEADRLRAAGQRIALVPTMGALHEGHLSLVKFARQRADAVFVSIFVNPTQFNDPRDFDAYPVDLARDLELCANAGVDAVFAPKTGELYPDGASTWVDVEGLTEPLCGASRPGHFRGVTSVVAKLFLAAKPHVALFGEKDWQQLAVIRRMERDLGFGIDIVGCPTVREPDGLALSSRNVRLGTQARRQAVSRVRALDDAEHALMGGEVARDALVEIVRETLGRASLATLDYAELRDPDTLAPAPATLLAPTLLALAVSFSADASSQTGGPRSGTPVRLIDNRILVPLPQ